LVSNNIYQRHFSTKKERKNAMFKLIILVVTATLFTGCDFEFDGDPDSVPDSTVELTAVGTVDEILTDTMIVLTNTGVELECQPPAGQTLEIGDPVQVTLTFTGSMIENNWMLSEIIFDKSF